ncbi:LacI family DNA-binding transcriptional regulator [Massilia sp. GER05]|uniref:LacI family DNA-binding transcriptional regulator n=1 Tax=Massilia sp. GER05 TaxID=3394605 RepID=UPI003F87A40B
MSDIARMAGVNVSTVSRALNGSSLTNEETRARILEIATALNYTVNAAGKSLRSGQSRTIGVVIPIDPISQDHISDPFFLALLGGIADALTERGYDMLVSRIDVEELEVAANVCDTGRTDGVILIGQWRHPDKLNQMAARGIPLIVWGAKLPHQKYATVGTDNTLGGELATGHLLDLGARRIAFLGDMELPEFRLRHDGYMNAHAKRGLLVDPSLTRPIPFVAETIQKNVEAMLTQKTGFDGLFAASDVAAMTAISTLLRAGVRVPEDVLVAGYDDIGPAAYTHPSLTTVRQPMREAGQCLVDGLMEQLGGEAAKSVLLTTELVIRESTRRI